MGLHKVALKNIKEHMGRFILLIAILSVSIATVVTLYVLSQVMYGDLQNKIDEYGANMVVVPKTKSLPLSYAGVTIGYLQSETKLLIMNDIAKIRTIRNSANINAVSPKLLGIMNVDDKKVLIAGVRFEDEFRLKQWLEIKSGDLPKKTNEVILGGKIARILGAGIGDAIDIEKEHLSERYKIAGVLKMQGSQDDELIYMNLSESQRILGKPDELSIIEVSAWCKDCPIDEIVAQISEILPAGNVSAVRQLTELREAVLGRFRIFAAALSATMLLVATLIIFTNILSSVRDRRREIGILRAIGYRRSHIMYLIMLETILVGIASGVFGLLIGFTGVGLFAPAVIGMDNNMGMNLGLTGATIGIALTVAIAASIYPAASASNVSPAEAIASI